MPVLCIVCGQESHSYCSLLTLTGVKMGYHHNPPLLSNLCREVLPLEKVMEFSSAHKNGGRQAQLLGQS